MYSNFLLGELLVSDAAVAALGRIPMDLIARHAINDYGRVTALELKTNALAMKHIGCITSRFHIDPNDGSKGSVLVVTDAQWRTTSVKLESEK